jgi:hypothetical protein
MDILKTGFSVNYTWPGTNVGTEYLEYLLPVEFLYEYIRYIPQGSEFFPPDPELEVIDPYPDLNLDLNLTGIKNYKN